MTYEDVDFDAVEQRAQALVEDHRELLRNLVAMRSKHHLTQAEVAARMGVSQPTVAAFERYDANPTLSTIRRYALAVDAMVRSEVTCECVETPSWESVAGIVDGSAPRPRVVRANTIEGDSARRWDRETMTFGMAVSRV